MTQKATPHLNLEQLEDEHADLRSMLQNLRAAFGERKRSGEQLAALLEKSRKVLEEHFHHEEDGGFFRGIREIAPQLAERVSALEHEHPQFLALIDRLRTRVGSHESEQVWREDCAKLFDEFLRSFLAHEAAEHELIQDAYARDIGAKD
jgi:hemerythrin